MLSKFAGAALVLFTTCSAAQAIDVRKTHFWSASDNDTTPKLGLLNKDPNQRDMSFTLFYLACAKSGAATIEAWPFKPTGASPSDGLAGLITDGHRHPMPGWRTDWNEMEEAAMVSVRTRDLVPVNAMIGARTLSFAVDGFEIKLPPASKAVENFVRRCKAYSGA